MSDELVILKVDNKATVDIHVSPPNMSSGSVDVELPNTVIVSESATFQVCTSLLCYHFHRD